MEDDGIFLMQETQIASFRHGIWVLILNGLKDVDFEWDFLDDWLRATWRPLMDMSGDLEEESVLHSQDRFPIFRNHLPCSKRERAWTGFQPNKKSEKKGKKKERASIIKNLVVPLKIENPGRLTAGSHTHGGGCFRWCSFLFMGVEHGSIGEQAVNLPGCTVPVSFKKICALPPPLPKDPTGSNPQNSVVELGAWAPNRP